MPRKRVKQQKRVQDAVASHEELADALGVHRNTIGAWAKRGAPAGPPYSDRRLARLGEAARLHAVGPASDDLRELIDARRRADYSGAQARGPRERAAWHHALRPLWLTGRMKLSTAREREQLKADILTVEQREILVANARSNTRRPAAR
jgi:IS30 family transposase